MTYENDLTFTHDGTRRALGALSLQILILARSTGPVDVYAALRVLTRGFEVAGDDEFMAKISHEFPDVPTIDALAVELKKEIKGEKEDTS